MKKAILGICAVTLALALAACTSAPASGSAPASQPATASQPASEPASEPVSQPASEPASDAADYAAYTLQFDVPGDFAQLEELPEGVSAMFQAADGSSLNLVIYENDGSLASDVTQETMVALLEDAFAQQLGTEVPLENVAFETGKLGDVCPYYRLGFTINLNGVTMNQTAVGVNADRAYTFTYTDMTGGDWAQAFEDSIASITPVSQ